MDFNVAGRDRAQDRSAADVLTRQIDRERLGWRLQEPSATADF